MVWMLIIMKGALIVLAINRRNRILNFKNRMIKILVKFMNS